MNFIFCIKVIHSRGVGGSGRRNIYNINRVLSVQTSEHRFYLQLVPKSICYKNNKSVIQKTPGDYNQLIYFNSIKLFWIVRLITVRYLCLFIQ